MFPVDAFQQTISKFARIMETLQVRYHLTGGAVSSAYGEPRLTQDIDIVIDPVRIRAVANELVSELFTSDFLFTESVVRSAIEKGELFQLLDRTESLKLDVYPRELISGELDRSQQLELFSGIHFPVVSFTDAALSKLIWIDKGSQRSRRDLRGMFRNGSLEEQEIIRRRSESFGLVDLLDEVLRESDEIR
jgi:hypothetical protein